MSDQIRIYVQFRGKKSVVSFDRKQQTKAGIFQILAPRFEKSVESFDKMDLFLVDPSGDSVPVYDLRDLCQNDCCRILNKQATSTAQLVKVESVSDLEVKKEEPTSPLSSDDSRHARDLDGVCPSSLQQPKLEEKQGTCNQYDAVPSQPGGGDVEEKVEQPLPKQARAAPTNLPSPPPKASKDDATAAQHDASKIMQASHNEPSHVDDGLSVNVEAPQDKPHATSRTPMQSIKSTSKNNPAGCPAPQQKQDPLNGVITKNMAKAKKTRKRARRSRKKSKAQKRPSGLNKKKPRILGQDALEEDPPQHNENTNCTSTLQHRKTIHVQQTNTITSEATSLDTRVLNSACCNFGAMKQLHEGRNHTHQAGSIQDSNQEPRERSDEAAHTMTDQNFGPKEKSKIGQEGSRDLKFTKDGVPPDRAKYGGWSTPEEASSVESTDIFNSQLFERFEKTDQNSPENKDTASLEDNVFPNEDSEETDAVDVGSKEGREQVEQAQKGCDNGADKKPAFATRQRHDTKNTTLEHSSLVDSPSENSSMILNNRLEREKTSWANKDSALPDFKKKPEYRDDWEVFSETYSDEDEANISCYEPSDEEDNAESMKRKKESDLKKGPPLLVLIRESDVPVAPSTLVEEMSDEDFEHVPELQGARRSQKLDIKTRVVKMLNMGFHKDSNKNEAERAMKLAQRLMKKHNLSLALMLKERDENVRKAGLEAAKGGIVSVDIKDRNTGRPSKHLQWLSSLQIAVNITFEVRSYKYTSSTPGRRTCRFCFYGIYATCQVAAYAFKVATERISAMQAEYEPEHIENRYELQTARLSYAMGLAGGLIEAANELRPDNDETETALVVLREKAEKDALRDNGVEITEKTSRSIYTRDESAYTQGVKDSKEINLKQRAIHQEWTAKKTEPGL